MHHQAIILSTLRLYLKNADPIVKMAAIEAIEATGKILFGYTTQVAQELQSITKQEYIYFGKFHLTVETGHAVRDDSADVQLASIKVCQ